MKVVPLSLGLVLLSLTTARGGGFSGRDDCAPGTRHASAEYAAEQCLARQLQDLDCDGLAAFAEASRMRINQRVRSTYHSPLGSAAAPPLPTFNTPTPPPPPPSGGPVFAPPRPRSGRRRG